MLKFTWNKSLAGFILAIGSLVQIATVNAATVQVDGIKDNYDDYQSYVGDISWTNGHKTEYSDYADGEDKTGVWYTQEANSLFLYMEVPIYAKNMIWGKDVTAEDILDYQDHWLTHHNGTLEINFKTATGSEKSIFAGAVFGGYTAELDGDTDGNYIAQYANSLDYLLGEGICDETDCYASNQTMSFEFEFQLDPTDGATLINAIETDGIEYHLSPERRSVVPIPAAAWLFGSALMGMGFMRRRKA